MSLLVPNRMEERASVILPTVTCSSCAAPIPLNSLGEHICAPAPPVPSTSSSPYGRQHVAQQSSYNYSSSSGAGPSSYHSHTQAYSQSPPRAASRPQLSIPLDPPRPSHSHSPSPLSAGSPGSFNRPFARSPLGSAGSSPAGSFTSQLAAPSAPSGQRTPSPTNPFFPQHRGSPERTAGGISKGPFPTDAPLPPGVHGHDGANGAMPDMTSGGNAGMAGVGRRAFAAAAWGVRAGVALAQGVANGAAQNQAQVQAPPPPHQQPQSQLDQAQPGRRSPHDAGPSSFPQPITHQPRVTSPTPSDASSAYPRPAYPGQRTASPSPREPVLLPKVSLKDRPRANGGGPGAAPIRSNSWEEEAKQDLQRKPSDTKQFFDRYKAMVASSTGSSTSPILGQGASFARGSAEILAPPARKGSHDRYQAEDDEPPSALPWAMPADEATPDIGRLGLGIASSSKENDRSRTAGAGGPGAGPGPLGRHKTGNSSSSNSSGTSGRSGRSAPDQEVVTPSQSWEGFADRRADYKPDAAFAKGGKPGSGAVGLGFGLEDSVSDRDQLELIREDDEEREQVVFGGRLGVGAGIKPSISDSSISTGISGHDNGHNPYRAHSRAQTAPETHAAPLSVNSHALSRTPSANTPAAHTAKDQRYLDVSANSNSFASSSPRRAKVCAKCSETVGGSKRFVERDGVVLCERDWKKMYLPSCRKCRLPIEKSAVSSSDGQLKGKWHRACFTCTRCDKGFETDDFYVLDGRPWCQQHYHEENGTLCAAPSCRQPIEGRCLLLPGAQPERFHPGHLRCDGGDGRCRDRMEEYYEVGRGRYCESHVQAEIRKQGQGSLRAEKRRTRMVDLSSAGGLSLR